MLHVEPCRVRGKQALEHPVRPFACVHPFARMRSFARMRTFARMRIFVRGCGCLLGGTIAVEGGTIRTGVHRTPGVRIGFFALDNVAALWRERRARPCHLVVCHRLSQPPFSLTQLR